MKMLKVDSSAANRIGYDPKECILDIEYKPGGVWRYFYISRETYWELMNSDSIGKYINEEIKGKHPESRIK